MSDTKEVFALIIIDMTEEQTTVDGKKWLNKTWNGYSNILQLAKAIPKNRVFDSRLEFDPAEPKNSLRVLYPKIGIKGTAGAQCVAELKEIATTYVKKIQYSSFFQTELDMLLKAENVTVVILCGIQTDFCVFATALDAFNYGYKVIIAKDACAAQNGPYGQRRGLSEATRFLGSYVRVAASADILKAVEMNSLSCLGAANENF